MRPCAAGARLHRALVRHRGKDWRQFEYRRDAAGAGRMGLSPRLSRTSDQQALEKEQTEPGGARSQVDDCRGGPRLWGRELPSLSLVHSAADFATNQRATDKFARVVEFLAERGIAVVSIAGPNE